MGPSVSFLGHASTLIEIDGVRVLTDPLLRSRITFLRRVVPAAPEEMSQNIDVVLISHLHHDHCDLESLAMLPDAIIIAPQGAGGYLRTRGKLSNVIELNEGEQMSFLKWRPFRCPSPAASMLHCSQCGVGVRILVLGI